MKNIFRIFIIVLFISLFSCREKDREIELTKIKLQEILDKKFPIEQNNLLLSFFLHDPRLSLYNERFVLGISFNFNAMGVSGKGTLDILGDIFYDREKAAFFLRNAEVQNLKFSDNKIKKLTSAGISKMLRGFFSVNPIYKLQDRGLKERLARFLLKEIKVLEDKILIILDAESKSRRKKD